jgi:hypothetical protein
MMNTNEDIKKYLSELEDDDIKVRDAARWHLDGQVVLIGCGRNRRAESALIPASIDAYSAYIPCERVE